MRKKLELAVKVLLIASFFVPLVVLPSSFIFPFIVPKILLIRTLSILMLAGYLALLIVDKERYKPRMDSIMIAVLAFLLSFAVSTFVGVDWYKSFYDNHERMLGLLTLVHFGFIYVVAASMFRTWDEWKQFFRWFLFAGSIVMIIGVAQRVNPELLLNRGSNRVSSTLGNAIYYSGYGLFLVMVSAILFARDRMAEKLWKGFYIATAALGVLGILFGGTRGTLLGLIAAMGLSMLMYFVFLKGHVKIRKTLGIILIVGVAVSGLLFAFRKTPFVLSLPGIGRLVNTSISGGTANTRLTAWSIGYEAWREMPVLGWGPNNFYYAFNKYYRAEMLRHGWGETWFDNAHNVVVNTLAVQGLVGILTYLAMFAVAIYALWKAFKAEKVSIHIFILSSAFLVGHFIHNLFVFENPTSYLYFFVFMAFLAAMTQPEPMKSSNDKQPSVGLVVTLVIIALVLAAAINLVPKRANNASLDIIRRINSPEIVQDTNAILKTYDETLSLQSPHIDDIRNDVSRSLTGIVPQLQQAAQEQGENLFLDVARSVLEKAYIEQEKNLELHPQDIRVHLQLAQILQQRAFLEQDVNHIIRAEELLREAITYSPKRQQLAFTLAPLLMQQGRSDEAVAVMRQAVDDDNMILESWWRYLNVLVDLGRQEEAEIALAEARGLELDFKAAGGNAASIAERIDGAQPIDLSDVNVEVIE